MVKKSTGIARAGLGLLVLASFSVQASVLDLNQASADDLAGVSGVGPVQAERIVLHRLTVGAFASLDDLKSVWGLDPQIIHRLRPHVAVHPD